MAQRTRQIIVNLSIHRILFENQITCCATLPFPGNHLRWPSILHENLSPISDAKMTRNIGVCSTRLTRLANTMRRGLRSQQNLVLRAVCVKADFYSYALCDKSVLVDAIWWAQIPEMTTSPSSMS